jgi:hypothetical protein
MTINYETVLASLEDGTPWKIPEYTSNPLVIYTNQFSPSLLTR